MKNFLAARKAELIRLDEFECCALARGFAKNPHTVKWLINQGKIDREKLKSCADGLNGSLSVAFPPDDDIQTAYVQIAKEEAKRLGSIDPETFDTEVDGKKCGHSIEEHKKALKNVARRLSKSTN